jgi:hypothetical protein
MLAADELGPGPSRQSKQQLWQQQSEEGRDRAQQSGSHGRDKRQSRQEQRQQQRADLGFGKGRQRGSKERHEEPVTKLGGRFVSSPAATAAMSGVVQSAMILPPASAARAAATCVGDHSTGIQHGSSQRVGHGSWHHQLEQGGAQEEEEEADMVLGTPSARWSVNATKQQDKVG